MTVFTALVLFSSASFLIYGISYFSSPEMRREFKRFGVEKLGLLVIILELLGSAGLLVGLAFKPILLVSAGGLALLMVFGLAFRLKVGDSLWVSLPAIFFVLLNAYIFYKALS